MSPSILDIGGSDAKLRNSPVVHEHTQPHSKPGGQSESQRDFGVSWWILFLYKVQNVNHNCYRYLTHIYPVAQKMWVWDGQKIVSFLTENLHQN